MRKKILPAFYPILHETFSSSYGFPFIQEFNPFFPHLVLPDRKHFGPILTNLSNLSFLFHQESPLLSYNLKNFLTKQFPKMQTAKCFQMFFIIGVLVNFPIFTRKCLCWSPFLIQLEAWRPATSIKKIPQHKCFSVNITKFLRKVFLWNSFFIAFLWLPLNMVEEFLRISNSG